MSKPTYKYYINGQKNGNKVQKITHSEDTAIRWTLELIYHKYSNVNTIERHKNGSTRIIYNT